MTRTLKTPLGIEPRWLWEEHNRETRVFGLKAAIERYLKDNLPIPQEWVNELNEHIKALAPE
mgnify:CR=1 FL=1